jgi:hypothetical protein
VNNTDVSGLALRYWQAELSPLQNQALIGICRIIFTNCHVTQSSAKLVANQDLSTQTFRMGFCQKEESIQPFANATNKHLKTFLFLATFHPTSRHKKASICDKST